MKNKKNKRNKKNKKYTSNKSKNFFVLTLLALSLAVLITILIQYSVPNNSQKTSTEKTIINNILAQAGNASNNYNPNFTHWYSLEDVALGKKIFANTCSVCHGPNGEGTVNWQMPNKDGIYSAPPLNGNGHTWHHPLPILHEIVTHGITQRPSNMPAFKKTLKEEERIAVLAYITSLWPTDKYAMWNERFKPNKKKLN